MWRDGARAFAQFDRIGHLEVRRRREVVFAYGTPGSRPAAPVRIRVGRLSAEDVLDELRRRREAVDTDAPFSVIDNGRLEYSRPWTLDELFPWQRPTETVTARVTAESTRLEVETAAHRYVCETVECGRGRPEVQLRQIDASGGEALLRVADGRVSNHDGTVLATFDLFTYPRSVTFGQRHWTRGFVLRPHGGAGLVYDAFDRRLEAGSCRGRMQAIPGGLRLQLDAPLPEVVALMVFAVSRHLVLRPQNLDRAEADFARIHGDLVEPRAGGALRCGFLALPLVLVGLVVASFGQAGHVGLIAGCYFVGTMLGIQLGRFFGTRAAHCRRFGRALHFLADHVQLCVGYFGHNPWLSYADIGHVESRGRRIVLRLSSGLARQPVLRVGLFFDAAAAQALRAVLDRMGRLYTWTRGDEAEASRGWVWSDLLPDQADVGAVHLDGGESTRRGSVRITTGRRAFEVSRKVVLVDDEVGETPVLVLRRPHVLRYNGMVLGRFDVRQDSLDVVFGTGEHYTIDAAERAVRRGPETVGQLIGGGRVTRIEFKAPVAELPAVLLLALIQRNRVTVRPLLLDRD